ncbi:hypothetical protein CPHO_08265 [Corynebacterium phocae]|uniref:Chitin-binding type-3 domain-containing protein n=1 Tax=Corynebacterium phocae TaxID=161895 RepID=A0A1L7D447_9CORY|nr:carbohydrate-binding protein [Corynebacterium phocae]APT92880.1 hypothetical protein CPHO_08265 [Corynebacterium phocae]KAA8723202.1 hypothetical protein F4V58_07770 [Corynebacterium phocae]
MTIEQILDEVQKLSSADAEKVARACVPRIDLDPLLEFRMWAADEPKRRAQAEVAEQAKVDIMKDLRQGGVLTAPKTEAATASDYSVWDNPKGVKSKAYLPGDKVFLVATGRVYESTNRGLNFSKPSETNPQWEDVTDVLFPVEDGKAKNVWATGQAYKAGDRVEYEGVLYQVTTAHTSSGTLRPDLDNTHYKQL